MGRQIAPLSVASMRSCDKPDPVQRGGNWEKDPTDFAKTSDDAQSVHCHFKIRKSKPAAEESGRSMQPRTLKNIRERGVRTILKASLRATGVSHHAIVKSHAEIVAAREAESDSHTGDSRLLLFAQ